MAKPIYFDIKTDGNRQNRPYLIFVEGIDDAHFVDVLLEDLNVSTEDVGIVVVKGKDNFEKSISLVKKSSTYRNLRGLAIIRDADDDANQASNAISEIFNKHFATEVNHGQIQIFGEIKLGSYILPGGAEPGDLEKACLSTVEESAILKLAEKYVDEAQAHGALNHVNKRRAQVYLAGASKDLCRGVGYGFKEGLFDRTHERIEQISAFLRTLLGDLFAQRAA